MGHRVYTEDERFKYLDGTRIKEAIDLAGKTTPVMPGLRPTEWQVLKLHDGRVVLVMKVDHGVQSLASSFRIVDLYGIDITEQLASLWSVLNRWAVERSGEPSFVQLNFESPGYALQCSRCKAIYGGPELNEVRERAKSHRCSAT